MAGIAKTVAQSRPASSGDPGLVLVVHFEGRSWVLQLDEQAWTSIGRGQEADVVIAEDEALSAKHARLLRQGSSLIVEDLESRNGTWISGNRIARPSKAGPGDSIVMGGTTLLVVSRHGEGRPRILVESQAFDERLAAEVARALRYRRSLSLMMLHVAGDDEVVDGAADAIASCMRPFDVMAEYARNQIAVILPEVTRLEAEPIAARILEQGLSQAEGAAVGVACFPEHGTSAGSLCDAARTALRNARNSTASSVVVAEEADVARGQTSQAVAADANTLRIFESARKVAQSPLSVLILGETGAGKEILAELIHNTSPRASGPLLRLNCASLPETLLERELFGHERGAFTGADRAKAGYFEAAEGGTLFLDELAEMPLALQPKLLGALERQMISRLGTTKETKLDVRFVAATNRDVERAVEAGTFRRDLYYRLAGFTIYIPPLRDRPEDILPLADLFCARFARESGQIAPAIDDKARLALKRHHWPGNIRELKNIIERAVVLTTDGTIGLDALPDAIRFRASGSPEDSGTHHRPTNDSLQLADRERDLIVAALEANQYNQTKTATSLGISRRGLIYKMERYGLKRRPRKSRG